MLLLVAASAMGQIAAQGWRPYNEVYSDAVASRLTGNSASLIARHGLRKGAHDLHLILRAETYDTRGTDLPFKYSQSGVTVGVGYRYWLPGDDSYGFVSYARGVAGAADGQDDFRAGLAGYREWRRGNRISDLYADVTYVKRADDSYLDIRPRSGVVLHENKEGRLWAYGVAQLYAAGTNDNGTENRIEGGPGIGYLWHGAVTLNLEARAGYSFRGQIKDKTYFNPVAILAGYWRF